jgi:YidC/Oxa1 family membrane protein insertase
MEPAQLQALSIRVKISTTLRSATAKTNPLRAKLQSSSLETSDIPGADYFINLTLSLENTTTANFDLSEYGLFLGSAAPLYLKERPTHTGFFWYEGGEMHFKDATKFTGGWFSSDKTILTSEAGDEIAYAGVTDQFFTTVVRPNKAAATLVWGKPNQVVLKPNEKAVTAVRAALSLPSISLSPGSPITLEYSIFTGPKANTMLRKLDNTEGAGKGWGDVMQYGFFWWVSRPLNWLLNFLHTGIDNISTTQSWGLSIICLTLIVRTLIWPLHAKSTHSMKRMSKLQPKMKELKEKYADDPNKLNTEMMGLYRKYGINPLGGCSSRSRFSSASSVCSITRSSCATSPSSGWLTFPSPTPSQTSQASPSTSSPSSWPPPVPSRWR